ncbi:hypothetical protein JWT41_003601 [Salmonella enterica subsp. enterica serovar Arechavaleta]|uniref:Inovirus Gp2 family protein n=1 Tax=Salmonella enterica TaxID=28901 RepID=A0A755S424_SALER|nr:hypothetical protein [Salmonella enterica subsp. enterica serovar Arechavaleta]EAO6400046.1 hypothetical protein [Salmonella enterica]EDQ3762485.1 hypothetical protein [Salmonella enterica subsp. enterica]EBL2097137.1 hypothetical protein [Salmonella enterica]EBQ4646952.1 hypothetical protein [Salmonella enterica]
MEPLTDKRAEIQQIKRVVQQAVDQYPRLIGFLITLPNRVQNTVQLFQNTVYQLLNDLVVTRQMSGKQVSPTILRWVWEAPPAQVCRGLLLMNQDTFCHPRHDIFVDCIETIEVLLHKARRIINRTQLDITPRISLYRVDRTRPEQSDTQYTHLQNCAFSLLPAVTALRL